LKMDKWQTIKVISKLKWVRFWISTYGFKFLSAQTLQI
jgi:hypothetical protein